ncbi:MAG: hypothetical protein WCJ17_02935 [bacterium]
MNMRVWVLSVATVSIINVASISCGDHDVIDPQPGERGQAVIDEAFNRAPQDIESRFFKVDGTVKNFRFDSALCSAERIMFADALVQPTVGAFKKKLITAAKLQKANEIIWKVQAVPAALIAGGYLGAPVGSGDTGFIEGSRQEVMRRIPMQEDESEEMLLDRVAPEIVLQARANVGAQIGFFSAGLSFAWAVPHWMRAKKRALMYRTFIKHADMLFGLLASPAFKQAMGVVEWSAVRKKRRIAEIAGLGASHIGAGIAQAIAKKNQGVVQWTSFAGSLVAQWALKPIIAKAIRKKGGVPELEKEFEKAIEMYERTGVVPYGATLDTSKPTGGTVSSATYQDSGTQGASYAVESARDTYLRLLAERAAAKKEAAQEASESAQD